MSSKSGLSSYLTLELNLIYINIYLYLFIIVTNPNAFFFLAKGDTDSLTNQAKNTRRTKHITEEL